MNRTTFLYASALAAFAPAALASAARAEAGSMPATLLDWAQKLVAEISPENNVYGSHPTYVKWADPAGNGVARNRSVCSSFASHLLEQSFGYAPQDIDTWFGKHVPQAADYHAAIVARNGFERIVHAGAIEPGDIIAVAYQPGSHPTGHVMIAASAATPRTATAPIEPGTQQYEIDVIDSANSGHGPTDTRHRASGGYGTGVGRGVLRLYARDDDTIAGHAWSTTRHSAFRPVDERKLAIGRLDAARAPHPSGSPGTSSDSSDDAQSADDAPTDS